MRTPFTSRARAYACILIPVVLLLSATAQDSPGNRKPSVTLQPTEIISINRGHSGTVELNFRVPSGFHINSNLPHQEYLKKTELKLNAPTDIVVRKITYPDGEDLTFPFAPDEKINVYTGDFTLTVLVRPLKNVLPTKYAVHGKLKYQACDNAACYPPRELAVTFEVRVTKAASETQHKRTPQSPHAH
jgi:Disulphide bond corrector protein DsbC